jgi:UDP-2-acetamido-3-amino-2,3-dideoxy-glucuronate N-acetyltransferase
MIWNWAKVREGAQIGAHCRIGQGVYIDVGVTLGCHCKIQNGVSIYQGVTIADGVLIGPHVTFTNDKLPRARSIDWRITPTMVEEGVSVGAHATIVCGVRLGRYCMVGAGAVVTRNVPANALVVGIPARIVDYVTCLGKRLHVEPSEGCPPIKAIDDL